VNYLQSVFTTVPWLVLAVVLVGYVFRRGNGLKWPVRVALALLFAFGCSRYYVGRRYFGDSFYPELPEWLHWFWCWLYIGIAFLSALVVVTWFWKARCRVWLLPSVAFAVATVGFWNAIKLPDVRAVEFRFADLPAELDGYRIVQVSDLHVSPAARRWRTQGIVDRVNARGADLVCLTGDYVDGSPPTRAVDVGPLRNLRAKDGVWFIAGNHEYYFDRRAWEKTYRDWGLRFLDNSCVFPRKSLALAGVPDPAVRVPRLKRNYGALPDVRKAFAAATNGEFRVLLQHQPKWAEENVRKHGVRLQLSGHTHGGIMPGLGHFVRKGNGGYLGGVYEIGDSRLCVSRGAGQWAGFQLRLFDPAEIVVITLRK